MIRVLLLGILILFIARAFWRVMDGVLEAAGGTTRQRRRAAPPMKLVKDPVCGTWVPERSPNVATAGDVTYYFCSEKCRQAFGKR